MRILAVSFLVAACSAGPISQADSQPDDLTVIATLGPQSFSHGTLTATGPELAFAFTGKSGDVIAPDVWPTGASAVTPTLVLLGPKGKSGHRSQLAAGSPRGSDDRHLAIDGFTLPQAGSYLIVVGRASGSKGGQFTLRLWMQSSHLPRQETSQVDLTLAVSATAQATVQAHVDQPHPWSDGEVNAIISGIESQSDLKVAISDAQALLWSLAQTEGTASQQSRARDAAVAVVGTQAHFRALDPQVQAFALWWLDGLLFSTTAVSKTPAAIGDTLDQLVASWPGAKEDASARAVNAKLLNGVVFGYQVEWSASQTDSDGTQVFVDYSREWFDGSGQWLGEQSDGASEPEDD